MPLAPSTMGCQGLLWLGSVPLSPYKIALRESRFDREIEPDAPRPGSHGLSGLALSGFLRVLVRARISCEIFPGVIKFPSLKNTCMFLPGEFGTVWFVC